MIHVSLSKREKYIFIAALVFIGIAILYNFILEPGIKKWQSANGEMTAKKARLNKGIRLLERRETITREYNKYARSTKNISKILSYVEELANSMSIRTSNIKPGQGVERGLYKEYNIELQIEGQFPDIVKFLSELIKLPTLVTLKKCDFRSTPENPAVFKGTIILTKIII
ncbi:MAG: type 4a pilus biogenesis protein PilO [Candidatus Omnitrophota bacterium]|nr:type 4a pilus biogenesis protein PilO [Candidatus Omnitrophota bacterium]